MKYFLVAVLAKEDNKELELIQRTLVKKSRNRKAPYICVPMDIIEDPDLVKLEELLKSLLTPYRYFHVDATGKYINLSEEKVTGLKVNNFGYIKKLQRHLNEYMSLAGFKVKERDDRDYVISMSQDKLPKALENVDNIFNTEDNTKKFQVTRIELWKTLNAKKDSIVFSIQLKNPKII